jgi:hypothetical protein
MVGLMALGSETAATPYMDVYYYNIASDTQGHDVLIYPMALGSLVDNALGEANPETGGASGEVNYIGTDGERYPVDCVVITVDGQPDALIYYVNDSALPDPALTEEKGRTINNGRFYIRGLTPGPATIVASIDGAEVGRLNVPITPLKDATGGKYSSNSTRIVLEGVTSDPTPDCPE